MSHVHLVLTISLHYFFFLISILILTFVDLGREIREVSSSRPIFHSFVVLGNLAKSILPLGFVAQSWKSWIRHRIEKSIFENCDGNSLVLGSTEVVLNENFIYPHHEQQRQVILFPNTSCSRIVCRLVLFRKKILKMVQKYLRYSKEETTVLF